VNDQNTKNTDNDQNKTSYDKYPF